MNPMTPAGIGIGLGIMLCMGSVILAATELVSNSIFWQMFIAGALVMNLGLVSMFYLAIKQAPKESKNEVESFK